MKIQLIVGLEDVRAADNLIISFDFDRNGYLIKMIPTSEIDGVCFFAGEPIEVAFINSFLDVEWKGTADELLEVHKNVMEKEL